jgi:dolichol-phosphate mannosyltransferase
VKTIVCIPTYNERENITRMIDAVHEVIAHAHLLIIDDGSPDGTATLVRERMTTDDRVHLIERSGKLGCNRSWIRDCYADGLRFLA